MYFLRHVQGVSKEESAASAGGGKPKSGKHSEAQSKREGQRKKRKCLKKIVNVCTLK